MSKQQTSIQKAIERSRTLTSARSNARNDADAEASKQSSSSGPDVFPVFRTAHPDKEVMERNRIVSEIDDTAAESAYNMLRTRVLQRMRSNNWRTLLVTSSAPGEGKTLTAANLAISLARDVNQSVLLVDLDLRRSAMARYFGFHSDVNLGIGDYLQSQAEASDIVYSPDDLERLSIIPNREVIEHSSDLLGSPRMKELLTWIRQQSKRTIVIFDMPPVLACDDVLAFCPEIDAALLVAAQGLTNRNALRRTMDLLSETNLLGVVLNRSEEMGSKESYGYY